MCGQNLEFECIPERDGVKVDGLGLVAYNTGLECVEDISLLQSVISVARVVEYNLHTLVFMDDESSLSSSAGNAYGAKSEVAAIQSLNLSFKSCAVMP